MKLAASAAHVADRIDRRKILRGAISLGALTMLTGCDVTDRPAVQTALRSVTAMNDRVQMAPDKQSATYGGHTGYGHYREKYVRCDDGFFF